MAQQQGIVIEVETQLGPDVPPVMGSESELREALINLVFNAVDSMPQGGKLKLATSVIGGAPTGAGEVAGSQVQIEVIDSGVGMDAATRARCLEPFFTTKGERGTGLGLAMVYGAVERHSGDIDIESEVGSGTTVRLRFPVATAIIGATSDETDAAVRPRLRILIVDDDPVLLKSLCDTLEIDGHVVSAAGGGQAGIDAFRGAHARGPQFDVVITDLGMPHVDGRVVANAIKATSRLTPVILLTGWGQRLLDDGESPAHVDRVLSKPPKLREIRQALAQLKRQEA